MQHPLVPIANPVCARHHGLYIGEAVCAATTNFMVADQGAAHVAWAECDRSRGRALAACCLAESVSGRVVAFAARKPLRLLRTPEIGPM
jgi:hypothetical protein